jgi:hypothetical protein
MLCFVAVSVSAANNITITSDDVKAGMPPGEAQELSQMMEDMRALQAAGRNYPKGDPRRRGMVNEFERVKAERDEKFGYILGLKGQSITLHGDPPPSKNEILSSVMRARQTGQGDGILHPHWSISDGRLIGSASPPSEKNPPPPLGNVNPSVNSGDFPEGRIETFRSDCCRKRGIPKPNVDYQTVCWEANDVGKGIIFGIGMAHCFWGRP